jgi:putative restriction endonuclease
VPEALEAAHICPYRGEHTNHVTNGVLLRADLHTLFDLGWITIDAESLTVLTSPRLQGSTYADLAGRPLRRPIDAAKHPSKEALAWHRSQSGL